MLTNLQQLLQDMSVEIPCHLCCLLRNCCITVSTFQLPACCVIQLWLLGRPAVHMHVPEH